MALSNERVAQIATAVGNVDYGKSRLEVAHARLKEAKEVCSRVGAMHGLRAEAIRSGEGVKSMKRPAVVLARSHAAATMRDLGHSYGEIGIALCCDRSAARRMVLRWRDFKANRMETVTPEQAAMVRRLMAKGAMTVEQACAEIGVGVTKFLSREVVNSRGAKGG